MAVRNKEQRKKQAAPFLRPDEPNGPPLHWRMAGSADLTEFDGLD
jgi:hypothetical protein